MSTFKPVITTAGLLSSVPLLDGQLVAVYDTGELYTDKIDGNVITRTRYSDVIVGDYATLSSLDYPLEGKICFAVDTHQLFQVNYVNDEPVWHELGGSATQVVNNSDSSVSVALANNTIYNFTNANIRSIMLTTLNTLEYCTICFTASTPTIFSPPIGSRCIGYDCSGGIFTPVSGKEYQIAVDKLGNKLTFYVLRMDLNAAS